MVDARRDARRRVPRTDEVLSEPRVAAAAARLGRPIVKAAVARGQQAVRDGHAQPDAVADLALASLPPFASSLQPVLNATGVLLHTNLGRASLSAAAVDAVTAASGTTDIEFDLATGMRARRGRGALAALAEAVPDAEAVHVVNNGAAAVALAASALAATPPSEPREVIVSRGEMIEIGDGFRLPDLVASTGAVLREVGTTNRTALRDYADAVGPRTAMVLKVHPSNFVVTGFTSTVPVAELTTLGVPIVADIGSGLLTAHPLLPSEPDAASALQAGAALVTASGDKLLGGPQAGLLLGRADLVQRIRRHPLARAVRVDKLTLAALEATLRGHRPPVLAALEAAPDQLRTRAERLAADLVTAGLDAEGVASEAAVGGGGAPAVVLPSAALALPTALVEPLRAPAVAGVPPVVGRVERGRCLLDLRTVPPERDDDLLAAVLVAAHAAGLRS